MTRSQTDLLADVLAEFDRLASALEVVGERAIGLAGAARRARDAEARASAAATRAESWLADCRQRARFAEADVAAAEAAARYAQRLRRRAAEIAADPSLIPDPAHTADLLPFLRWEEHTLQRAISALGAAPGRSGRQERTIAELGDLLAETRAIARDAEGGGT